jgi:hypothetical protein
MTDAPYQSETLPGFWQTIREAIRGIHHDYTSGPIGRSIILLAVPIPFSTLAVASAVLFRRGRWKLKTV